MHKILIIPVLFMFSVYIPAFAREPLDFPYTLSQETDFSLLAIIGATALARYGIVNNQKSPDTADITSLRSSDLNIFDRSAIFNHSATANDWSNITLRTVQYSFALYSIPLLIQKRWYPFVTIGSMYCEALALNECLTDITKSLACRPRPYEYGSDLDLHDKLKRGKDGFRSFYSGHSSGAFCSAVFLSRVYSDMYPDSHLKVLVWGLSLSVASATGILRYEAGKHFPTDIITGACMGSLVGYLIPVLHTKKKDSPVSVYPISGDDYGFCVVFRL